MKMSLLKPLSLLAVLFISLVCLPAYTSTKTRNDLEIKQVLHHYFQAQDQALLTDSATLTTPFFDPRATKAMKYEADRVIAFQNMQKAWNEKFEKVTSEETYSSIIYVGDIAHVEVSRGFVLWYDDGKDKQYLGGKMDFTLVPNIQGSYKIINDVPNEDYVKMALQPNFTQPIQIVVPKD